MVPQVRRFIAFVFCQLHTAYPNFTIIGYRMTGNAPVHPRLTPKQTPDADLIQGFIVRNGVTKPTTAQQQRAARKEVCALTRCHGLPVQISVNALACARVSRSIG